jgi:hypothetical protein
MSSEATPVPAEILELIRRHFTGPAATYGPYRLYEDEAEVVLPNVLYRLPVAHPRLPGDCSLRFYRGIGQEGGILWEQEVQTLMRVARLGHPALPNIVEGGYSPKKDAGDGDDTGDFAYVVTAQPYATLDEWDEIARLRANKKEALRQFGILAEALTTLHMHGVMHRNLSPRSIECFEAESGRIDLRLVGFETSMFVENLFREPDDENAAGHREAIRQIILGRGPAVLACYPPERLAALAWSGEKPSDETEGEPEDMWESERTDVYSLGVIAYQWFVGDLDVDGLLNEAFGGGRINLGAARLLRARWRDRIRRAELTQGHKKLLLRMLEDGQFSRPASHEVCDIVARKYDSWSAAWAPPPPPKPYLIGFLNETGQSLLELKLITHSPTSDIGRVMARDLIQDDVKNCTLVYSPDGVLPYVGPGEINTEPMLLAKYVLLGKRAAWFCQRFYPDTRRDPGLVWDEILLIKYVSVREPSPEGLDKIGELYKTRFGQKVGAIDVIPANVPGVSSANAVRREIKNRPSWASLLEVSERLPPTPPERLNFEMALKFLLLYKQVELAARYYPFKKRPATGDSQVVLEYDKEADDERMRKANTALFAFYLAKVPRPSFGDFFRAEETYEDSPNVVSFYKSFRGLTGRRAVGKARVLSRVDEGALTLRVSRVDGEAIPEKGWLRPACDRSKQIELERQEDATGQLVKLGSLVEQMLDPWTVRTFRGPWVGAGAALKDASPEPGAHDGGEAPGAGGGKQKARTDGMHFVQELLRCYPFYALHGPPGTGKTTVVTAAIEALLARNRTARILVSAQSNYALDNLGERIAKKLRDGHQMLRIVSDASEARRTASGQVEGKVSAPMREYQLRVVTERLAASIKANCKEKLKHSLPEEQEEIVKEWLEHVDASKSELQERIRAGANIILATCSLATKRNIDRDSGAPLFDWVIIEEAARAWPTELAVPLVRGLRWALIGDHKQLPAHKMAEVKNFLAECERSGAPGEIRTHAKHREDYLRVYKFFEELFKKLEEDKKRDAPTPENLERPLGEMKKQFRMRKPISDLVSAGFYDGTLQTSPTTERPLRTLPLLGGERALYWVDTSDASLYSDEGYEERDNRSNPGEARIVCDLVAKLKPVLEGGKPRHSLAILTPYNSQLDLIRAQLSERVAGQHELYNVHQIQGREADVVIVSLVRTGRSRGNIYDNLGFMADPELINVLLSRARLMLVIVGNYDHFKRCGEQFSEQYPEVKFWERICNAAENSRVPADSLGAARRAN